MVRVLVEGVILERLFHRGQAKVDDLRLPAAGNEDVAHLQVPVGQARGSKAYLRPSVMPIISRVASTGV